MSTKHTPGPWVSTDDGWIEAADGSPVADYRGCGSHMAEWPNPADKTLAVAAPELLWALKQVLADLPMRRDWLDRNVEAYARDAIAKATEAP